MRKYAMSFNQPTKKWSIIFQDDYDHESDVWYMHLVDVSEDKSDVKQIVEALNR